MPKSKNQNQNFRYLPLVLLTELVCFVLADHADMYFIQQISRKLSNLAHSDLIDSKIVTLVQQGQYVDALQFYSRNPLNATRFTYPSLLKACGFLSNLQYGKTIHSTIITKGFFYSDPYITTSLINFYFKCGSFGNAVNVFDKLPESEVSGQDVTFWNSIVNGYFRFGHKKEGIAQFCRMQLFGVRPDAYSLCILLGASDGHLGYAKQIHGYSVRKVFYGDPFLDSALIYMYFSCGRPLDAWRLFKDLEDKGNVVAWNVMIGGFGENGLWENSLEVYLLAKNENVKLVSASFTSTLSACCQGEFVSFGMQVHCDLVKLGFENDPYVCTSLLTMYSKCKLVEDAENVFDQVSVKKTELWNAMISAYVGNGRSSDGLKIYKQMKLLQIPPDSLTATNVLSSCCLVGSYDFGRLIHAELVKRPIQSNVALQSALLTMYSKCGNSDDANSIFNTIKGRDVVAWGSMISGFCQNRKYMEALEFYNSMTVYGEKPDSDIMASVVSACTGLKNVNLGCTIHGFAIKSGLEQDVFVASSLVDMYSKFNFPKMSGNVFSDMPLKNLVAWNSIISCYCRNGLPDLSISLFSQMTQYGLFPDSVSITSVLVSVSSVAVLRKGKAVHGYLIRQRIPSDLQLENALIDMYIKCGFLKYAQHIFQNMLQTNLVTWNIMIAGCGSHGDWLKAMRLFDEMRSFGIAPDDITFISLLTSCNHCGFIEEGLKLFQLMTVEHGIEPRMEHYVNIVDLLGRAGRLDDAYAFVKNLPIEPDRSIWLSLLCSCRVHHNVVLGKLAAHKLLDIEPSRGSNYVQLLNLYGENELQDRAANLRASMKEKGLKKSPGCSWIEVGNSIDVFFSGDSSSPRTIEIYDLLNSLRRNMRKKGGHYESVEAL
jgi:pentatricopeptide repeat protein